MFLSIKQCILQTPNEWNVLTTYLNTIQINLKLWQQSVSIKRVTEENVFLPWNHIYVFQRLKLRSHIDLLIQTQLSDTEEPEEESVALSMWLIQTQIHQGCTWSRCNECHSLKFRVNFISHSAHGDLTAAWFKVREYLQSRAAVAHFELKLLFLTDDPWHRNPPDVLRLQDFIKFPLWGCQH